jgi:hypothetical protein
LTTRILETVEAGEAATFARDAGQADVEEARNMGETLQDARREEEELPELWTERDEPPQWQRQEERPPQPQPEAEQRELGQPEGLVGEAKQEAAVPPPDAQTEVLASGEPFPFQGPMPAMIDLTSDDPPSNKGKQKADIEMVDASNWPRTSAVPDGDAAKAFIGWPDFVGLTLV